MFISTNDYLKRITHSLEHVVVPEIESDFARGQVLAAVFLLDQLMDRIDYKTDLIEKEVEPCCALIKKITDTIKETTGNTSDDLVSFIEDIEKNDPGKDIKFRDKSNEMLCSAIDLFFENRLKMDPDITTELNNQILEFFGKINARDFSLFKMSTSGKLIQTKD